jgi:putative hydrolase of the HAD superfamily
MTRLARNVIFDFGGVLVRWRPQEIIDDFYSDEALRAALKREVFQHPDWLDMDRGALSEENAATRFAARLSRPPEEMRTLLHRVKESLTPIEESFAITEALHRRSVPLYGLSNMPAFTFSYLRARYPHWRVFRGIVISGEVKLMKPERAIFDHISTLYNLDPGETVFIDDSLPNVEAARSLGFQAIHYTDANRCAMALEGLLAIDVINAAGTED